MIVQPIVVALRRVLRRGALAPDAPSHGVVG